MQLPSVSELEQLAPDLVQLSRSPLSTDDKVSNFENLIQNAARKWVIKRSLYDCESDFFVDMSTEWFQCASWYRYFCDRVPNLSSRNIEDLLLGSCSSYDLQEWQRKVSRKFSIDANLTQKLLSLQPFKISYRTITNDFVSLTKLTIPILEKCESARGKYRKVCLSDLEEDPISHASNVDELPIDEVLALLNENLSSVVELLLTKIGGHQRLFLHTEYVVKEDLQDLVGDWADRLKELWKQAEICPISIQYNSASKGTKSDYTVYPVCLYYHQRAYYLCAFGQTPQLASSKLSWYNYRLERITNLTEITWDKSEITQQLKTEIYDLDEVADQYTPKYIQEQLELAYGFDFYRPKATMLLRFNQDFDRRYIKDTIRHRTFKSVDSNVVKSLIVNNSSTNLDKEKYLVEKVNQAQNDAYYTLDYREGDNNVIMRLRAWGFNVEVLMPLDLRQRMRDDMEQNWKSYEPDQ